MLTKPISAEDHIAGLESAPITLVEYGDFECPHCGRAFPIVEEVRRKLGDQMRFVFRHFPLSEIHSHAEGAAEAAEAAGAQGKFWEMHHLLFQHQDALALSQLLKYPKQLGIDAAPFEKSLKAKEFEKHVRADFMSGVRSGVNGTPTFFINGIRYDGYVDVVSMVRGINEFLP
jgi:protein-disulfide isomerase